MAVGIRTLALCIVDDGGEVPLEWSLPSSIRRWARSRWASVFDSGGSATWALNSFDGGSFAGTGGELRRCRKRSQHLLGELLGASGTAVGRSGSYLGSFMRNLTGTDKAAETGGRFQTSGTGYKASGNFAGAKVP